MRLPFEQVGMQLLWYLIGSTLRHNTACIWNDICDRDFDRHVGAMTSLGGRQLTLIWVDRTDQGTADHPRAHIGTRRLLVVGSACSWIFLGLELLRPWHVRVPSFPIIWACAEV